MEPLEVHIVWTGNICRSPAGELLLRHHLEASAPRAFRVSSSGPGALVGSPVHPLTVLPLADLGVSVDEFHRRQRARRPTKPPNLMLMLNRRLQVLLDEPRWVRLAAAARHRGVSVAVVVRDAIDQALADPASDERDDALRRLLAAEPVNVPADPRDLKAEIAEARQPA